MTTMEDRIGYATGLDSLYFSEQVEEDVKIPYAVILLTSLPLNRKGISIRSFVPVASS